MGVPNLNDGSIERADLDGKNRKIIVPQGVTHTPKQIHLDKETRQALLVRPRRDARDARQSRRFAARDPRRDGPGRRRSGADSDEDGASASPSILSAQQIYWTQKGPDNAGHGPHLPRQYRNPDRRERSPNRSDIEVLYDGLPEPIDLELDHRKSGPLLDRPRRSAARQHRQSRSDRRRSPSESEIVVTHLMEGIGIALDVPGDRMFVTDFAGSIYSANLDGSGRTELSARPRQPHRHRLRRNLKITLKRRTDHVEHQAYSPRRDYRHRRHWRELGRALPGQRPRGRRRPMSRRTQKPP